MMHFMFMYKKQQKHSFKFAAEEEKLLDLTKTTTKSNEKKVSTKTHPLDGKVHSA